MHQDFNNLLVVQDAYRESLKAIEWASKIIPDRGSVMMLDVQPPLSKFWQEMLSGKYEETPVYHRQKALREHGTKVDFKIAPTARVRSGTPAVQIIREVLTNRFDLLIKEAYGKTSDLIFGSLDMRLLRHCPIPIWMAHPEAPPSCSRVLVALNPEADPTEMLLNERLLKCASGVARGFRCQLFIVGAFQGHKSAFPILDRQSPKQIQMYVNNVARQSRKAIDGLLAKSLTPVDAKNVIISEGWPTEVIVSAVKDVQPDLLVMGSVARHGLSGLLVGNAAEQVLSEVNCSVLAVKPNNFTTPIQLEKPRDEALPDAGFAF